MVSMAAVRNLLACHGRRCRDVRQKLPKGQRAHMPGSLDGPVHVLCLGLCHRHQRLAGAGVVRLKCPAACCILKFAVDQQLQRKSYPVSSMLSSDHFSRIQRSSRKHRTGRMWRQLLWA